MEADFLPAIIVTDVDGFPHRDQPRALNLIPKILPQNPFWLQLPKNSPLEKIILKANPSISFLNDSKEKKFFDHERIEVSAAKVLAKGKEE